MSRLSGAFAAPLDDFTWTLQWVEAPLEPLAEATITVSQKDRATRVVTYRPLAPDE
jgi:hypothetical protein